MNSSISCPDDLGHRDVTTGEAPDFAEFSKMALENLLDAWSTNLLFVIVHRQPKLTPRESEEFIN